MDNSANAKSRLLNNTGCNILDAVIAALIGLFLTPFLVHKLGVEVFGLIPLVTSIVAYYTLITGGLSASVGRFVGYHLNRSEDSRGNVYFNSALLPLLGICLVLGFLVIALSSYIPVIFQVPKGHESETISLFRMVAIGTLLAPISGVFQVSTYIRHRFDLMSMTRIISKLVRLAIIVLAFTWISKSLNWVGLAFLAMSTVVLLGSIFFWRRLTPELRFNPRSYDRSALLDMSGMSFWLLINRLMALLYVNTSIIIINIMLGPAECGHYGAINQWGQLLTTVSVAISTVFGPIALEHIAKERFGDLTKHTKRATRYMGLILALPVGLLCGYSEPLLSCWLGPEFTTLVPLLVLIVAPKVVNLSVMPMFAVRGGLNKVKTPALYGLAGAVLNVILSIVLIKYTELGITGVALATMISISLTSLLFTPIYNAKLLGEPKMSFYYDLIPGLLMFLLVGGLSLLTSQMIDLATLPRLFAGVAITSLLYLAVCWRFIFAPRDRDFFLSLISKKAA